MGTIDKHDGTCNADDSHDCRAIDGNNKVDEESNDESYCEK